MVLLPENKEWMFLDPNCYFAPGYISYRHVISYTLQKILHNRVCSANDVTPLLSLLKTHWDRKSDYDKDFFISMRFNPTSISIVDHSKGCYPLILEGGRIEAFQHALDDIYLHIKEIIDLLLQHSDWCLELQNKLNEVYSLPRRN